MTEMYDDLKKVEATFNEDNLPEYLIQARWAEFVELKRAIHEISMGKRTPLKVLDIGIGDGRIIKHLSGIKELWDKIERYDGIDVAQNCVDISKTLVKNLNLSKKVKIILLDAVDLNKLKEKYDLIVSTWFTVGNFYPSDFDFNNFKHGVSLDKNDKFEGIFRQAYSMLNSKGEIVIGSMYLDNENTRKKQEEAYKSFGWTITSNEEDCFVSTSEEWWSQRFTKKRVYGYLSFIPKEKISFIPLDTYDYAMMVRIQK